LPDLARAATQLCDKRHELPQYTEFTFEGYTLTGQQLANAIADATGRAARFQRMAWWPLQLARPFWPLARGLVEMRYLWDKPHHLVGDKLREALPEFRDTPLDEALRRAVAHTAPAPKPSSAVPATA
jgi:nucleoside-diphosphate-sugar epimerase